MTRKPRRRSTENARSAAAAEKIAAKLAAKHRVSTSKAVTKVAAKVVQTLLETDESRRRSNWTEAQTAIATVALEVPNDPLLQDLVEAIKQQGPLPSLERLPLDRF